MTQKNVPPQACLEPEALAAMAEGRLTGAERDTAIRHLAHCRDCRDVLVSTVRILEEDGPQTAEVRPLQAVPSAPRPRRPVMMWLSAAAAALASAAIFVQRAPVLVPRVADASPSPSYPTLPTGVPTASPSAPVQTAALPREAIDALRTLRGFASPYTVPPARGFAPDPDKAALRRGIDDVDSAARALSEKTVVPDPSGSVDRWRRVGRVLEASRLALASPHSSAHAFFASEWTRGELAHAASVLREAGVADAAWPHDVVRRPLESRDVESLLDRLDALLRSMS